MRRKVALAVLGSVGMLGFTGAQFSAVVPIAHASSVATQGPRFFTYSSGSGAIRGIYTNVQEAIASLNNVPGGVVKNQDWAVVYTEPKYVTYSSATSTIAQGVYTSPTDAIDSLSSSPGSVVKDASGAVIFTEPDFRQYYYSYKSDSGQIMGVFTNINDAVRSVAQLPGGVVKNQNWQIVYQQPRPSQKYYTYSGASSNTIVGVYTDLQAAVASLKGSPGAVIKNQNWEPIFRQPLTPDTFFTYSSATSNQIIGSFSDIQSAVASLANSPGGVVKNSSWQYVYTQPQASEVYYTYLASSPTEISGTFRDLQSAVASLTDHPGALVKASTWEVVYRQPTIAHHTYFTYADGSSVIRGMYDSLQQAIDSLRDMPGGVVKNSDWAVEYVQPLFFTYSDSGASVPEGRYASLSAAALALSGTFGSVVRNEQGQIVFQQPDKYFTYASATSNTINGIFLDFNQAKSYMINFPGGVIKNSHWAIVYNEPPERYYTYSSASSSTITGTYDDLNLAEQSLSNTPGGIVKNSQWATVYTEPGYQTVDLRFPSPNGVTADQINAWFEDSWHDEPLQGLGQAFLSAQQYGVNATYLLSHAVIESMWGKSNYALGRNNLFGYGAYDHNTDYWAAIFPSETYAIQFEAWDVHNNYLIPSGDFYVAPTLSGMGVNYASSGTWANSISTIMNQYVSETGGTFSSYKQYSSSNVPPTPTLGGSLTPQYELAGATAHVISNTNYSSIPVFSSYSAGANQMFPGRLNYDPYDSTEAVKEMQRALKSLNNSSYDPGVIDGYFGNGTLQALNNFQSAHNLTPTKYCDAKTWQALFPASHTVSTGTTFAVDAIVEGDVIEQDPNIPNSNYSNRITMWYHIPGEGWVDSEYVAFDNVFMVEPTSFQNNSGSYSVNPNDVEINVYSSQNPTSKIGTIHAGRFVTKGTQAPSGYTAISYVDTSGSTVNGLINTQDAKLVGVPARTVPGN